MKLKDLMKKTGAIFMASAMLCTGAAAVLPLAVESGIVADAAAYGDYEYKVLSNGTVEITGYNGSASSLSIPGSINGKKVTSIGEYAFCECTSLKSVTIPSGVKSIGEYAFCDCTSLKSVTIPSGVTGIGDSAFKGCKGLADKNGFVIIRNVLYYYCGNSANVTIPSSVKSIGAYAFSECTSLKSVTIPSSVTSIGMYAFYNCTSLKSVTIPSSVTSIGMDAFEHCTNLTSIKIPSGVKSIGKSAFYYCTSLTSVTVPSSVKSIGYMAFGDCTSLKSVTIPSSVKSIGGYAFYGCKGLADKNGFVIFGDTLCYYCGKSKNIVVPSSIKTVGGGAFSSNEYIESVTISDSVTEIGHQVFMGCINLKRVTLPKRVKSFGSGLFISCENLERVVLPEGIDTIPGGIKGGGTFLGCKKLLTVTIPSSVKRIGEFAFGNCESLKSITIPSGVKSIGEYAFYGCKGLADKNGFVIVNGILFDYFGTSTSITIPSGVKEIGINVFQNQNKIKSVTIPSSVKSIESWAFDGCTSLTSVTIPSSVKSIGENAIGYYLNSSYEYEKVAGFTIYGTKGSAAEKYAKDNGFKFVELVFLNTSTMSLGKGETTKLTATGGNGGIKWRTSNSKIITVDQKGNVKAVNNGTAWVTAKGNNGQEKSCKITVKNAPTKVTLTKGILTIGVGEKYSVNSGVNNGAAAAKRTYRTSNSSIVKMTRTDWQGDFVGVKPGVAYVTVRTYNGKESTCKVTVKAAPTSVTISKKSMTMKVGQTASLSCSVPSNAGCATRTYRTSNSSVIKMTKTNWTGEFKAMKPGVAWVTVRTYNGKESSCKITVVK